MHKYNILKKLELIKPGILLGNLISLSGGFFLASRGHIETILFLRVLLGITCIISSACILNNIIDRDLDKTMHRTKYRILCISNSNALVQSLFFLALFLFILGLFIFYMYINVLSAIFSIIGIFFYVILYSLFLKRITSYSTIVGSVSGSLPPIIGYIAVKNNLDLCCLILFFIFSFWQIAHAYSIILYRINDYTLINIPTVPILHGIVYTKKCISICIISLFFFNFLLFYFSYVNILYFFITSLFIFFWFCLSIFGHLFLFSEQKWSRIMFLYSILLIFLMSFLMSANYLKY